MTQKCRPKWAGTKLQLLFLGLKTHCYIAGWEVESSAIGDALGVDEALGTVGIDGNDAEDLIFRPEGPTVALTMQRYRIRRRIFDTLLKRCIYHRFGGPQFSGMILACFLGGRTPVVSRSFSSEKSNAPSMLKLPHDCGE